VSSLRAQLRVALGLVRDRVHEDLIEIEDRTSSKSDLGTTVTTQYNKEIPIHHLLENRMTERLGF
jgi:hypothetical protein